MDRAYANITGFIREADGRYTRFSQMAYNIVIDEGALESALRAAGFTDVYRADTSDLTVPAREPDPARRAFFVCRAA
jgi:hypothetical protein